MAAGTLPLIGRLGGPLIPGFLDQEPFEHHDTLFAVVNRLDADAVRVLTKRLQSTDETVRRHSIYALVISSSRRGGEFFQGEYVLQEESEVFGAFDDLIQSSDLLTRDQSIRALTALGPHAAPDIAESILGKLAESADSATTDNAQRIIRILRSNIARATTNVTDGAELVSLNRRPRDENLALELFRWVNTVFCLIAFLVETFVFRWNWIRRSKRGISAAN